MPGVSEHVEARVPCLGCLFPTLGTRDIFRFLSNEAFLENGDYRCQENQREFRRSFAVELPVTLSFIANGGPSPSMSHPDRIPSSTRPCRAVPDLLPTIHLSTWVFVTCSNCSQETLAVAVVCSKSSTTDALSASDEEESSESLLSTPTIVVIAVGLAIFVCLILGCCAYRRKRAPRGSSSFEHESELTDHKIGSGGDAGTIGDASSVVGLGAESSAVGEPIGSGTVGPSSVANSVSQHTQVGPDASVHTSRSSLKGAHAAPMAIRNNPSYHSGHNSPPYDPRAISMQSASGASGVMIDSMAASAAAAVAAIGQNSSGPQQPPPAVALVGGPERHRRGGGRGGGVSRVVHEDNIVWSAGQDYTGRNGRYNGHMPSASENGDDSAAGSVFSLNPDNVPDRAYYDSESVPASSPGGYSMYSYFTAGGNSVYPGDLDDRHEGSEMSWNAEDELHRQSHHVHHAHHVQPQGARRGSGIRSTNPPPYGDSHVDAVLADPGAIPAQQVGYRPTKEAHLMRSPAGLAARADLATREGSRRTRDPKERSLNRAEPLRKAVAQRQ